MVRSPGAVARSSHSLTPLPAEVPPTAPPPPQKAAATTTHTQTRRTQTTHSHTHRPRTLVYSTCTHRAAPLQYRCRDAVTDARKGGLRGLGGGCGVPESRARRAAAFAGLTAAAATLLPTPPLEGHAGR